MDTNLAKREQKEIKEASTENIVDPSNAFSPDTNIYETGEEMIFTMDMPGVKKGDVALEVDGNNSLCIRGENSAAEPNGNMFRQFSFGNYYRCFTISDDLDKDKISAKLDNGVLEIKIPKRESLKPKRIQITA